MNTKALIAVAGIILLIAGAGLYYFFSLTGTSTQSDEETPGGFFSFLNFGGTQTNNASDTTNTEQPDTNVITETTVAKLRKIALGPVAGAIATTTKNGNVARYIERGTGHVSDVRLDTGEELRQSNTTIPRIQEAQWFTGGEGVVLRYFDDTYEVPLTFIANLLSQPGASSTAPYRLDGTFLEEGIRSLAVSKTGSSVGYISRSSTGGSLVSVKNTGLGKATIVSTPLRDWHVQWFKTDTIALTTSPSGLSVGYLYTVPAKGGSLQKILGGRAGLTTLMSPSGEQVLFTETLPNTFASSIYFVKTEDERGLPIATLPEKCVWGTKNPAVAYCGVPKSIPPALYPDDWYKGLVSFEDNIWRIDTKSGSATLIALPEASAKEGVDVTGLSLTADETYLIFINKKDLSLWTFDLRD